MLRHRDETPSALTPKKGTAPRECWPGGRWVQIGLAAIGLVGLLASPSYAATSNVDVANSKKAAPVSAHAKKPVAAVAGT